MSEKIKQKLTLKQKIAYCLLVIASTVAGWAGALMLNKESEQNLSGSLPNAPVDLIGTRSGTTTTGVSFDTYSASSTYRSFVGADVDTAVLTLKALTASSTGGAVTFSILGSNSTGCNTASTTGGLQNPVLIGDVEWFDLTPNIKGLANSATTLTNATGTISWAPITGLGKEVVLTDLNTACIALEVRASSTILYAQLRTKQR